MEEGRMVWRWNLSEMSSQERASSFLFLEFI